MPAQQRRHNPALPRRQQSQPGRAPSTALGLAPGNGPGIGGMGNAERLAAIQGLLVNLGGDQDGAGGAPGGQTTAPPKLVLDRYLKRGRKGEDVKALQGLLGMKTPSGTFDQATYDAVKAFQTKHKLGADGVVGGSTAAVLNGGEAIFQTSLFHDKDKFVPSHPASAYAESNTYRKRGDPYAVGAISRPTAQQDTGGKTYGTYQFESYIYRDGSKKNDKAVDGSTVMRFIRYSKNPYSKQLKEVVDKHGLASAEFDALWGKLATDQNKAFGAAQEAFLEHDIKDKVDAFFATVGASSTVRKDPELKDVVMGTVNQYGGLASSMATHVAGVARAKGRALTADEIGIALQDIKKSKVTSHFKSSPKAWEGIRARIKRERALFSAK